MAKTELLSMSGDIAVPGPADESLLWRTLEECGDARWVTLDEISPGVFKVRITAGGRLAIGSQIPPMTSRID
jgi:hypothetical protein